MTNQEIIQNVQVVFQRAQKAGILEMNEVPVLLTLIEELSKKLKEESIEEQ